MGSCFKERSLKGSCDSKWRSLHFGWGVDAPSRPLRQSSFLCKLPWLFFTMTWGSLCLPVCHVLSSASPVLPGSQQPSWKCLHAPGVSKSNTQTRALKQLARSLREQVPEDLFISPVLRQLWQDSSQGLGCGRLFTLPRICHWPGTCLMCVGIKRSESSFPARDTGGICSRVYLASFTDRGFADHCASCCSLVHYCAAMRTHLRMLLDLPSRDHQTV